MTAAPGRPMPAPRRIRSRHAFVRSRLLSRRLQRLAKSSAPIVAGPWVLDAGLELLYWIPFLRWLTTELEVDPRRVAAVSRAGADPWYADVAGSYVDLLDHFTAEDVRRWSAERQRQPSGRLDPVRAQEQRAFELGRDELGGRGAEWLEPSLLYRLFDPHWRWLAHTSLVGEHTLHRPLPEDAAAPELPRPYVALEAHFDPSFPDTAENRRFVDTLAGAIARRAAVVLLRVPQSVPGTEPYEPQVDGGDVRDASPFFSERESLGVQTRIVRDAEVLVTSYGGLSYLGPYVGTPTVAFYSHGRLDVAHLSAIERIGRRLGQGQRRLFRARHVGHILLGQ